MVLNTAAEPRLLRFMKKDTFAKRRRCMFPLIQTRRFYIRPYEHSDAEAVWEVVSNKKIYETTYAIPHPYPRGRVDWWFRFLKNSAKHGTGYEFGIFSKTNGAYVGNIGLINISPENRRAEVCYFINPAYWNAGCATECLEAILRYGFEILKLKRISGRCMSENRASYRVMEKCGFVYEGTARCEILKDGLFRDIDHLSMLDADYYARNASTV